MGYDIKIAKPYGAIRPPNKKEIEALRRAEEKMTDEREGWEDTAEMYGETHYVYRCYYCGSITQLPEKIYIKVYEEMQCDECHEVSQLDNYA